VSHQVLCWRARSKPEAYFGKCNCGALLPVVGCQDDLIATIKAHNPQAIWAKHPEYA
jgi:hypothetical protein